MNVTYHLCVGNAQDASGMVRTVYGIELRRGNLVKQAFPDLFTDADEAEQFVQLCNRLELSEIHFRDVVEDVAGR